MFAYDIIKVLILRQVTLPKQKRNQINFQADNSCNKKKGHVIIGYERSHGNINNSEINFEICKN